MDQLPTPLQTSGGDDDVGDTTMADVNQMPKVSAAQGNLCPILKPSLGMLKDMIRIHDPTVLIILETRISIVQADKVCAHIGFDEVIRAEVVGFRGGIWVLYDRVSLVDVDAQSQVISLTVNKAGMAEWVHFVVYASPTPNTRHELWSWLLNFGTEHDLSWLLIGDFNETKNLEKNTGDDATVSRRRQSDTLLQSNMIIPLYSSASLALICSNDRPFRFQAVWLMHKEFQEFLTYHWDKGATLSRVLYNLVAHLDGWNKMVFGNLFRRRDKLWRRIQGVQRELESLGGEAPETTIHLFWVQKARSDALLDGDHNTHFFHVVKIERNKIEGLYDARGEWIMDHKDL
ncbi:LOW QUALITY PROTEIN: hypothetical protein V2J09_001206 [Rumex salicifolius]